MSEQMDDWLRDPKLLYSPDDVDVDVEDENEYQQFCTDKALQIKKLRMPRLLAYRKKVYGIPDLAFRLAAEFDRVLVWQIPLYESDTFAGTSIVMADVTKRREAQSAPRGIIISAGAAAMEYLVTHGMALGHIVRMVRLSIWTNPIGFDKNQKELTVSVMRACDVAASEDSAALLHRGLQVRTVDAEGKCAIRDVVNDRFYDSKVDPIVTDY